MPLDTIGLEGLCKAMLGAASGHSHPICGLELQLVDDRLIAQINAIHLGSLGPTNIISFPGASSMPGILVLSLDTLHRECLLYGQTPLEHLARLLAHGMGHLAGFEHGEEMDGFCHSLERSALAFLARFNPFHNAMK